LAFIEMMVNGGFRHPGFAEEAIVFYLLLCLAVAGGLVLLWVILDLLHFLIVRLANTRWEARIPRDPDGVRHGCREFTLGQGDTALLLVHGFGDSPIQFRCLAAALAERGFTCRAMRLPQFALPMAAYRTSTAAGWRQAVHDELQALKVRHSRVAVVAFSLGAAVAIDYLIDHPDAVDASVLLAPLLGVCNRRSPLLAAETWYHLLDRLLIFSDRVWSGFPPDVRDPQARPLMAADVFVPRTIYREMFALLARIRQRRQQFRTPLFLVLSRHDLVIDGAVAEEFYERCAAPLKRLQYAEEAGHQLPLDFGWRNLVDETAAFIENLPQREDRRRQCPA
jgi:esterase/lipase